MSLRYRTDDEFIIIFGNTYPVKEQIKNLGGHFLRDTKVWRVPKSDAALTSISELCAERGGGVSAIAAPPRQTPEEGISVRELLDLTNVAIAKHFPETVWVIGEIQNFSKKTNARFLNLAEAASGADHGATLTVRAVIWSQAWRELSLRYSPKVLAEVLQDGMQLRVLCRVQFYKERASLSLSIEDIDPDYTKGALALARERTLRELRAAGLDQLNKTRVLSPFPLRVGLITAADSRAQSDFEHQLTQADFPGGVLFAASAMQGEATTGGVLAALARLVKTGCDVIVLTRGGGSQADLRWFDDRELATAIARCPVPVVSAIGHHDDVSVAEEISYRREKTPTAAAAFLLDHLAQTQHRIEHAANQIAQSLERTIINAWQYQTLIEERLDRGATTRLTAARETLFSLHHALSLPLPQRLERFQQRIESSLLRLEEAMEKRQTTWRSQLDQCEKAIVRKDPQPWIQSGWTQLQTQRGRIRGLADVEPGACIYAQLADGRLAMQVTSKTPKTEEPTRR